MACLYCIEILIWQCSYQPHLSTRDTHISPRAKGSTADMCQGLIWGMIWKLPYHNLFIIHFFFFFFFFWQVCLFDVVCWVKDKTSECCECDDMGFYARAKKPYQPHDLVICFVVVFSPGKKAVSPTWPGDMFCCCFLSRQKSRIIHVTHYHTFCAPQGWYELESHVSITYAKWTYFLVNVW